MLSSELEFCLNEAFQPAREARHEFMTVEHLLLAIIDTPTVREILRACGADLPAAAQGSRGVHRADHAARSSRTTSARCSPRSASSACCSARCSTCSRAARRKCRSRTCWWRSSARSSRTPSTCWRCRTSRGSTWSISFPTACRSPGEEREQRGDEAAQPRANARAMAASRAREVRHQSQQARPGRTIDPLIGRQLEVERTIEILCRRRKNNPLYVGEAGVGKTAIAEGLARLIVEGKVPEVLRRLHDLLARHGLADRRHQVPRRLREAPQGA